MNKYLYIFFYFTFFLINLAQAQNNVNVEVVPERPTEGDNFQLVFKINSSDESSPDIAFDPGSCCEVLGKSNQGLSIRTTLINGRFTTTRELSIVYDLVANKSGKTLFKNISVDIGGQRYKVKDFFVDIAPKGQNLADKNIFLMAVVNKKEIYVGEGLNVDYYIYTKVPVVGEEISEFPKLNQFTKRFQNIRDEAERVEYNGQLFVRSKKYSARVYADKAGKAIIDPMRMKVQYSASDSNSPFSGFGFSMRQYRTASISSQPVEITVLPLPTEGMPQGFTGLVGKHDFKLAFSGSKYLVNEAIELKFEVTGDGALEKYDAPTIYSHDNLEKFDTKADFEELSISQAKKKFEYTYLGRGPLKIDAQKMTFVTFNPVLKKYETATVDVPELRVEGGAISSADSGTKNLSDENREDVTKLFLPKNVEEMNTGLLAPELDDNYINYFDYKKINIVLISLFMILVFSFLHPFIKRPKYNIESQKLYFKIKGQGATYEEMFNYLKSFGVLTDFKIAGPLDILNHVKLSGPASQCYKEWIEQLEKNSFHAGSKVKLKVDKKMWKELYNALNEKVKISENYR